MREQWGGRDKPGDMSAYYMVPSLLSPQKKQSENSVFSCPPFCSDRVWLWLLGLTNSTPQNVWFESQWWSLPIYDGLRYLASPDILGMCEGREEEMSTWVEGGDRGWARASVVRWEQTGRGKRAGNSTAGIQKAEGEGRDAGESWLVYIYIINCSYIYLFKVEAFKKKQP